MKISRRHAVLAAALAAALSASAARAEPAPVVTRQQIHLGGKALAYTAEAGRLPIRDVATGEPLGHIFYVAYRASAAPGKVRPITFVWNGGPGMPAASLHFEGAGPRRIEAAPPLQVGIRYLRHDLGFATDLPYLGVEPIEDGFAPDGVYPKPVNARWTHSTVHGATPEQITQAQADFAKTGAIGMGKFGPNLPGAADAMKLNPALKVLVPHGAYDPLGGCSMDAELGRRLTPPARDQVTFRCYLSGHAIYRDALPCAQFADDMRALARAAAATR